MAHQPHESTSSNWPPRRLSVVQRRSLVLSGLLLLALSVTAFVRIVAIETVRLERRTLAERQFQLGGFLGGMFREIIGTTAAKKPSVEHTAKQAFAASSSTPSLIIDMSKATINAPEPSEIQINATSEPDVSQGDLDQLLDTLANAVKEVVMKPEQSPSTTPTRHQKGVLSDMIIGQSNAAPLSAGSSVAPILQPSRSNSAQHLPTPSVGLLGGFWGDSHTLRVHNVREIAEIPPLGSSSGPSFLSDVSKIVTEIADIDLVAAAQLTDTVLDALHVDSSAIASIIPKVADAASVTAADLLPLVIPAVAKAMDLPIPPEPPVSSLDMADTLNKVLQQGTTVINDLSRAMDDITDPALLGVVNQLATIVTAVADYLEKPLCAIDQVVDRTPFEAVIPCDSAESKSLASTSQPTTSTASTPPGSTLGASSSGGITTPAPPSPYVSSETQASSSNPAPPSTSVAATPATSNSPAPTNAGNDGGSAETPAPSSCPTCPSCDLCPPKICSVKGPESPSVHQPPDPSIGPCSGKGFKCNECLDGWFCPPRETPAQVVPCGVGWPCYHCSAGFFCAVTQTPGPTPPPTPPSSAVGSSPTPTGNPSTNSGATPTKPSNPAGLPADWNHLGCFQDAISRILVGAKPLDYLQGDMSSKACVDHCISGGYKLAGTENGRECWCGASIRDDAVRLPETQCGKPCQGKPTETCGGSWAIDVFLCSEKPKSLRESPGKMTGGFMFRLLSNFRGNNGKANHQRLKAVE